MLFSWLKRRRRRRILATPFPAAWHDVLDRNVYHYGHLAESEQAKLRDDLRILVAEKNWEGCGGLEMTDEIRVTIAGQAALLLLAFKDEYFDMIQSILVYPDSYFVPEQHALGGGGVLEGESHREGEAWYRGPVILSWTDSLAGSRHETDGDNLVLHEFAHQLDMHNGRVVDGTPSLATRQQYKRWQEVVRHEYRQLRRACRHGRPTLLGCYGATNIGEFFAVSTECFFEQPNAMSELHPDLYDIFRDYFRQDPARRGIS